MCSRARTHPLGALGAQQQHAQSADQRRDGRIGDDAERAEAIDQQAAEDRSARDRDLEGRDDQATDDEDLQRRVRDNETLLRYAGSAEDAVEGVNRIRWALDPSMPKSISIGGKTVVRDWL